MPVYGLADHPLGLTACSGMQWEQSEKEPANNTVTSIEFRFLLPFPRSQSNNFKTGNFTIRSLIPKEPWDLKDILASDAHLVFRAYDLNAKERAQAGNPQIIEQDFLIADLLFSGGLVHWVPPELTMYTLQHEGTNLASRITGTAFRLSLAEVTSLLEQLITVNDRPDLLTQYQAECRQNR